MLAGSKRHQHIMGLEGPKDRQPRFALVALDLPAGTQPAGEQIYTLTADETRVTGDVYTNNNTSSFAASLWLDSDGDGIPDNWMMQYFGHATGQAGDLSRAQDEH